MKINIDDNRPIIFAADVHLKPRWSASLPAVVEDSEVGLREYARCIEETNAGAIILGGDIFDTNYVKHLWLQRLFFSWVDEVTEMGCQVLAYPGNHDAVLHQLDPNDPVHIHSTHPRVIDIDGQTFTHGRREYGCVGHCDHPGELLRRVELLGDIDTLLLHQLTTDFGGSTNLDDMPKHIRTIVLGDVHAQVDGETANGAWWGFPGCMFPQNIVEKGHGVFVITGDPKSVPMRKEIVARSARQLDVSDEASVGTQLATASAWVKARRKALRDHIEGGSGLDYLKAILRPVVYFRVARNLIGEMKKAVAHDEIGDDAHVIIKPISVLKHIDFDVTSATSAVPTPIDLLPEFVRQIEESPNVRRAHCPYPQESAAIVRDLLLSGGAGRKAGDDEKRADGKPLAHKALIAMALADVKGGEQA